MTYFGVLARFILPPLIVLAALTVYAAWRAARRGESIRWVPYVAVLVHVLIALAYTTPWDNYLVATGVWWYDPALVTGLRLGYVPIEEYTFFVVQTLMTGLWVISLIRWGLRPSRQPGGRAGARLWLSAGLAVVWLAFVGVLIAGWQPGRYLALILVWAIPPLFVQSVFGGDILQANWRLLAAAIIPPTLYLWLVDAIAIGSGTWTINPADITGLHIGPLPIEEMTFFLVTNMLITFGITLILAPAGERRLDEIRGWFRRRGAGKLPPVDEQQGVQP